MALQIAAESVRRRLSPEQVFGFVRSAHRLAGPSCGAEAFLAVWARLMDAQDARAQKV